MKKQQDVKAMVRELDQRTSAVVGVEKLMIAANKDSLVKAEKLRRLTLALIESQCKHQCFHHVGGSTAVSAAALADLQGFVKSLGAFSVPAALKKAEKILKALGKKG